MRFFRGKAAKTGHKQAKNALKGHRIHAKRVKKPIFGINNSNKVSIWQPSQSSPRGIQIRLV